MSAVRAAVDPVVRRLASDDVTMSAHSLVNQHLLQNSPSNHRRHEY